MHSANQLDDAIISNSGIEILRVTSQADLDACLRLRHEVFTIEQGVDANLDNDGHDKDAFHYLAVLANSTPIGTARAVPTGSVAKIGRVAVLAQYRKIGIGRKLMQFVMSDLSEHGFNEFVLGSQLTAEQFYERLGFAREGEEFLDAGIPHIMMRFRAAGQGDSI